MERLIFLWANSKPLELEGEYLNTDVEKPYVEFKSGEKYYFIPKHRIITNEEPQ